MEKMGKPRKKIKTIVEVESDEYYMHECVFIPIVVQYAMRMRQIVFCGLSTSIKNFQHDLINATIFGGKKILKIKCVF
jgi:hypothetical protein